MSEQDIARLQEQIKTLFGDVNQLKEDVKEINRAVKEGAGCQGQK